MMWKKLRSFFRKPTCKQLLDEAGFERLEQKFTDTVGLIDLDYADVQILRKGEAAFLWESPPCASVDEMMSLASLAAAEMAPKRGRKIVSALLYVDLSWDERLEGVDEMFRVIQRTIPEDVGIIFGCKFGEERSFLLATSEERAEAR